MTDIRITDYDMLLGGNIRRFFANIYPYQPEIVDRMCYDPARKDHVATKVAREAVGTSLKFDGSVKSPISALCCILRHCGVGQLRLIPQDLHAPAQSPGSVT